MQAELSISKTQVWLKVQTQLSYFCSSGEMKLLKWMGRSRNSCLQIVSYNILEETRYYQF